MKCGKAEVPRRVNDRAGAEYPATHSNKITIHGVQKCSELLRFSETPGRLKAFN